METQLVRLKDYDPRRGNLLRRYTYRGIKFVPERGWYRVDRETADYLRTVRQDASNPHAPPAFDVATEEEAQRLDTLEAAREQKKPATDPVDATVAEPPATRPPARSRGGDGVREPR
jgi:hypothetical protein